MDSFQLEITSHGPATMVVSVGGELDISTVPTLRESLQPLLDQDPPLHRLTVDLERVSFMDSTGLAVLVDAHRQGHTRGVEVRFCSVQRQVRRLFDMTGVSKLFAIDDDPQGNGHCPARRASAQRESIR